MQVEVEAKINFVNANPFIKGTINYNNNSNVIDFYVNGDGKHESNNNNVYLKACFNKENEAEKSVTFKIPTQQAGFNFHYLVSAVTSACLQLFRDDFTNISNDDININYTALTQDEQQNGNNLKMLNNLDDVEFIVEEKQNINSVPQNIKIIDNDIQSQQDGNNVEKQSINDVGSRNLNNNISISNNDIVDIYNNVQLNKSEENNNDILPECCNNCITGLQNLWDKIKCW